MRVAVSLSVCLSQSQPVRLPLPYLALLASEMRSTPQHQLHILT